MKPSSTVTPRKVWGIIGIEAAMLLALGMMLAVGWSLLDEGRYFLDDDLFSGWRGKNVPVTATMAVMTGVTIFFMIMTPRAILRRKPLTKVQRKRMRRQERRHKNEYGL